MPPPPLLSFLFNIFNWALFLECLHLAFVLSPVASGTICCVNVEKALLLKGVIGYINADDVPGSIWIGHGDTPIFAKDKVIF